ncbi:MAG: mitochondrial escape protein 2 [Ramalina farinacea]|uniref:Mitochondrial escape protein 2 n=1 Tax=Ramalina farinacea TaxID=258253 RepID=A0AA43QRT1_9LECA|nr:mitochondrial escape protein 2 [Ramalina farinacea]
MTAPFILLRPSLLRQTRLRSLQLTTQTPQKIIAHRHASLRHSAAVASKAHGKRFKSTDTATGDEKTGHIECDPGRNEGLLFLDNVFPLKLSILLNLPFRTLIDINKFLPNLMKRFDDPEHAAADPGAIAQRASPSSAPFQITNILPRVGEGGAFVKFTHGADQDAKLIEKHIKTHLKEKPIKPWFNPLKQSRAFLVKGVPWLEDLHRTPSPALKVEFVPPAPGQSAEELGQEVLYTLFRRYGKLKDITPQPTDSKDLPKYAMLRFHRIRHAIMAKNCLHGYTVPLREGGGSDGTSLKMTYQQTKKAHFILDWLLSHPRITFPLLVALATTLAVAIFDPIRTFSIKAHVTHSFHITDNKIYKWFRSQASRANQILKLSSHRNQDASLRAIWDDRKDDINQIQTWLMESADTFIVIQGPRGSGKKELVLDQALKGRHNNLLIDCKAIQEARGDAATICAAAEQVGYRPIFSWMNSISSLIDLAAQGTIGTKTGFSETLDTQLQKIWQSTTTALREIALDTRTKEDKDAQLGDDEYLEAHPEIRPVIVIDNFLHKSAETNSLTYDKIAEWAAQLTTSNTAHVIFLTNDVSFSKSLSKALPDRVFRQISLGDLTPDVAKRFVLNHLDADTDAQSASPSSTTTRPDLVKELELCLPTLGGRLTDLEFLARRLKSGEPPRAAVNEIIAQSASEILKMYIMDPARQKWSPTQAWTLIKSLAERDELRYHEVLLNDVFASGGEATLQALEQAELITIISYPNGRPKAIRPGKPVYTAAFRQLTEDPVLTARLDLAILGELAKEESTKIQKAEEELKMLGELPGSPGGLAGRVKWLVAKIGAGQEKVEGWEREGKGLKEVLGKEF